MKKFNINDKEIKSFCERWKIRELRIFGSGLRNDFRSDSDVDVLVDFEKEARWTLFDLFEMQEELRNIFGREVDIITRRGLETSENYLRRRSILSNTQVIYAARS